MRAHGNYAENMPIFLILLALLELARGDRMILWAAAIAFILARLLHAFGMDRPGANWMRVRAVSSQLARPARPRRLGAELRLSRTPPRRAPPPASRPAARLRVRTRYRVRTLGARQHAVGDEGVGPPLLAEGAHRAVAGDEMGVVAQWPQPGRDRVDQILVIAHREVGAADRALEQTSPTMASFEAGWWKTTWPGVWPGQ